MNKNSCNISSQLPKPLYFHELLAYPISNPILITLDHLCLQNIRRLKGVCIFCDKLPEYYDFSFCFQREVWVLYSTHKELSTVMKLSHAVQWVGASKILVIFADIFKSKGELK